MWLVELGLITCEKCAFSATAKPRSVWNAQCRDVVWTQQLSFSSTAVATRKAMTLHQQDSRMSVRETQSRDLTTV